MPAPVWRPPMADPSPSVEPPMAALSPLQIELLEEGCLNVLTEPCRAPSLARMCGGNAQHHPRCVRQCSAPPEMCGGNAQHHPSCVWQFCVNKELPSSRPLGVLCALCITSHAVGAMYHKHSILLGRSSPLQGPRQCACTIAACDSNMRWLCDCHV